MSECGQWGNVVNRVDTRYFAFVILALEWAKNKNTGEGILSQNTLAHS